MSSNFRTGRWTGIAAAIFLVISTFIAVLSIFSVTIPPYPTYSEEDYPEGRLQYDYLKILWEWRRAFFGIELAIEFFLAIGLLMVIHPVNCLKKIYSQTPANTYVYNIMSYLFILGVALNGFEFLENLGTQNTAKQLTTFVTSSEDLAALEISYNLGEALSIWIFSMDYIFLGVGFALSTVLSFKYPVISTWHGVLGAINAMLCFAAFALEIAQVANSSVLGALGAVTFLWTGLAFPIWVIWLSWNLGFFAAEWKYNSNTAPPTL